MPDNLLETLKAIDPVLLTAVVRQDQRSPAFTLTHWAVQRLSDKGIMNPDGLWFFSGQGADALGERAWSVVLKIFTRPEQEGTPGILGHWQHELLVAGSGLTERLPGPVRAPRLYQITDRPDGAWLWMEHVRPRDPRPWTLADYAFAARELGRWNAAIAAAPDIPDFPWLVSRHYRTFMLWANPEKDWQFPLNQKHISPAERARYDRLYDEREQFCLALERLPQFFSHFDAQRRNLFIRSGQAGQPELAIVDWAACGYGPLGGELYSLIGMSAVLLEWPPENVRELDQVVFSHYVAGLRDAGWSGDEDGVRLACTAWISAQIGCVFPAALATWCGAEMREAALQAMGLAEEDLFWQQLPLVTYTLDCADEARSLMRKLGLG